MIFCHFGSGALLYNMNGTNILVLHGFVLIKLDARNTSECDMFSRSYAFGLRLRCARVIEILFLGFTYKK